MAETENQPFSDRGIVAAETEVMVCLAVHEGCEDCYTANFAPRRLGDAVAKERVSEESALDFARRLNSCPGILEEAGVRLCRLPSAQ
jgi:hypothetical protein